jgi:predicted MPP superfamily phosphohydrolase
MKSILPIATFIAFLCSFFVSSAQPKDIHLSWSGKKIVKTSSSMSITWNSDKQCSASVRFGSDSVHLTRLSEVKGVYAPNIEDYVYKATLDHLRSQTVYYYKVGSDECGWSRTYSFKTAPIDGRQDKYVIGVWSDTQNDKGNTHFQKTAEVESKLLMHHPDFTLHIGDMVENGSVVASWKSLFRVAEQLNATAPFMPVTGNHDVVNDSRSPDFQRPFPVFYSFFDLPRNSLDYSYNYGNAHFVAINSGFAQGAEKLGKVLFDRSSSEYHWLEKDLKKARKDKKITWIILYCHYPIYSFGVSHASGWERHIAPLLDKYKVDLCLSAHRHVYERHTAIRDNKVIPQKSKHQYYNPQGTVYITNGTSGGTPQGVGGADMPSMVYTPSEKMYSYALMMIHKDTISYDVYNLAGKKIDYFKLIKTH